MEPPERKLSLQSRRRLYGEMNRHVNRRKRQADQSYATSKNTSRSSHLSHIPHAALDPILERYVQFWFGRDSKTTNDDGCSALMEASIEGDEASIAILLNIRQKILREDGQDIAFVGVKESSNGWTALHHAVFHKKTMVVRLLLDVLGKRIVNVQDKAGDTALHLATQARRGDEIVRILLQYGASMDVTNKKGRTPLHFAASHGYGMVRLLCENGANVDTRDCEGQTPLFAALAKGYNVIAETLLEHGADPNGPDLQHRYPLHKVMKHNDYRMVGLLVKHGADVNVQDGEGCTPLLLALMEGENLIAMELLEYGADPNITDRMGRHTLHNMKHCDYRMVSLLCKHGANVNIQNDSGQSPLLVALSDGDKVIAMELLEHGADPNIVDHEGRHPLHNVKNNDYRMVNLLCKYGANVNVQDATGKTLLFTALSEGDNAIAMELLEHGADPNIVDHEGRHPLHNIKRNDYRMVGLLCDHGANVDVQDSHGRTPLFVALSSGENAIAMELLEHGASTNILDINGRHVLHNIMRTDYKIVSLLCMHGASVNVQDNKGRTPLFVALLTGENAIAMELLENGANPNITDSSGRHPLESVKRFDRRLMEILRENGADLYGSPLM